MTNNSALVATVVGLGVLFFPVAFAVGLTYLVSAFNVFEIALETTYPANGPVLNSPFLQGPVPNGPIRTVVLRLGWGV